MEHRSQHVAANRTRAAFQVMVTQCNASDGILREHARGKRNVVLSVAMLSQYATWNKRHVHMARCKRVMVPCPCSCDMVQDKPNSPLLVDAREGRLFVLLACCLECDMPHRRMGIV